MADHEEPPPGTYDSEERAPGVETGSSHFPPPPESHAAPQEQAADQGAVLDAGRSRAEALAALFAAQAPGAGASDPTGLKRKLDDDANHDAPDSKRPASMAFGDSSGPLPPPPPLGLGGDAAVAMETIMCPPDKVGRVIGRAGATIRDLEASTGTRIQVDHKAPGDKPVTISGRADEVERAKRQVLDLISGHGGGGGGGGPDSAPAPGEVQKTLECPQGIVGRVIGRGGETIRTLQQASGAHILVNQDFPDGAPRQITISGSQDAVDRAASMVQELIGGEHANTQQVIQRVSGTSGTGTTFGVGSTEVLECPKTMVGRIIGKGGETIKDLQKRFNASIQIDQSSMPCKVTITGPSHTIASARRAIEDLIRSTGPPGMGGGSRPPFGAPYGQQYPGGAGGYGGYGGYGGAPGGYGGAPGGYPGGYGGYGGYPGGAPYGGGYGAGGYGAPGAQSSSDPYGAGSSSYGNYGAGGSASGAPGATGSAPAAPGTNGSGSGGSSPWQALQDDQGRTYYYNGTTGVSQWERPADMP